MGELHHECRGVDGGEGVEGSIQNLVGLGPTSSFNTWGLCVWGDGGWGGGVRRVFPRIRDFFTA